MWARPLPSPSSQALSAGLFTTLSPCSHGLEPGTGVFTNLLCLLWGEGRGTVGQKSFRCKPRGNHGKCRCFALGECSLLLAAPSLQALTSSPAPGSDELGFWYQIDVGSSCGSISELGQVVSLSRASMSLPEKWVRCYFSHGVHGCMAILSDAHVLFLRV